MRGYVASLTLKNYPDVDIFVMNPRTQTQRSVQVKTIAVPRRKSNPRAPSSGYPQGAYFVPESIDRLTNTPFVFVTIDPELNVEYFIAPSERVAEISEQERQQYLDDCRAKGRAVSDSQPRMISRAGLDEFRDRWDNLGLEAPPEVVAMPLRNEPLTLQ
jgi:hypothetical protein